MSHNEQNVLTRFEEQVMCLIRLTLNLSLQDLAYRFGVSVSTASRIVEKWLNVLHDQLGPLIRWPSKDENMKTMPMAFRENFGCQVRAILDCFEVCSDRPSSLDVRAGTWSSYKNRNTAKFLIAICPLGSIIFLSKSYGGRNSVKSITEHSGFLGKLEKDDVILADRGFLIEESVGLCCAKLNVPAFTKGKHQLTCSEVEATRQLANVRIHVERVIGMVRNKYTLLKGPVPVEALSTSGSRVTPQIDKIATVCCALVNLCNSVISSD